MFGAAAMSLSSFCVVTNALRLNLFKMYDGAKDKKVKKIADISGIAEMHKKQEESKMEKKMMIEGMMCKHCEARVKKVLEALPEVESADVSHETNSAIVKLSADLSDEVLKATVEAEEYPVLSIE